ncbi:hypothetical protein N7488_000001 [Penicillium malachiteum]|nr:hypothetical protein N7488_000001 [Penicillium malachiteum]
MRLGFLGLGVMRVPMARNLAAKFPLAVWYQSPTKSQILKKAGASTKESPQKVPRSSDITFLMLFNVSAINSIMSDELTRALREKTLFLDREVQRARGNFVETPVSGSKVPPEQGQLVGMMAGNPDIAKLVRPYVEPLTCYAIYCGHVGSGLKAKYAINTLLITATVGLAKQ